MGPHEALTPDREHEDEQQPVMHKAGDTLGHDLNVAASGTGREVDAPAHLVEAVPHTEVAQLSVEMNQPQTAEDRDRIRLQLTAGNLQKTPDDYDRRILQLVVMQTKLGVWNETDLADEAKLHIKLCEDRKQNLVRLAESTIKSEQAGQVEDVQVAQLAAEQIHDQVDDYAKSRDRSARIDEARTLLGQTYGRFVQGNLQVGAQRQAVENAATQAVDGIMTEQAQRKPEQTAAADFDTLVAEAHSQERAVPPVDPDVDYLKANRDRVESE